MSAQALINIGMLEKHAAPIHPGTGTDQSVHGSGGGGASGPKWEFTEPYESDSDSYFAPGLEPVTSDAKTAFAEVKRIASHIDELNSLAEVESAKIYDQMVEDYLTDDYARFDRAIALKLMKKRGLLSRYRRDAIDRWQHTPEGKRWRLEVIQAQIAAKMHATAALPELLDRGRLLHDEVLAEVALGQAENKYEGNPYFGGYTSDQKRLIAEENPEEFGELYQKIQDGHTQAQALEETFHQISGANHQNYRPGEMQEPTYPGGNPWKRANGDAFFALHVDDVKTLKDGDIAFKDWKKAANTTDIHYEVRTLVWPTDQGVDTHEARVSAYTRRFEAEKAIKAQFQEDMGPDYVIVDTYSYDKMWDLAKQSGRSAVMRQHNKISTAVDEFDQKAESFFKTTRQDLVASALTNQGIAIGGEVNTTHGRKTKGTDTMAAGARYLPTAWIERSNSKGPVTLEFLRNSRAHYEPKAAKLRVDGSLSTTLHEFGHRIQHTEPTLRAFEDAFYDYRTDGEEFVRLKDLPDHGHYDANETTKADKWHTPYTGKSYRYGPTLISNDGYVSSNNMMEVVSTGYPKFVMTPQADASFGHEEEAYFIWGLLDATAR